MVLLTILIKLLARLLTLPLLNMDEVFVDSEVGFSLQDIARQDLLNGYWKVRRLSKQLIEEKVKLGGFIRTRTALEALNVLYEFVDEVELKNRLHYKRKELDAFNKFTHFYFEPQLNVIIDFKKRGLDKIPVSQNGFSVFHFRRWKKLCRLLVEVSGVTKFERPKELTPELAFAAGAS